MCVNQMTHTNETSTQEIYSRDVCRASCRHPHPKETCVNQMRPTKETYKRELPKRPTKETYKRDLQKRPTAQTFAAHILGTRTQKRHMSIKWDIQKRPTKETHETVSTRICKRDKSQSNQIYVNKKKIVKETHTRDIWKSKETYKGDTYESKENYKGDK